MTAIAERTRWAVRDGLLIAGRDVQRSDDARSRPVAVISQSLASRYFPGRPPVGGRLQLGTVVAEIVGVAKDVPYAGVRRERELVVYRPYSQDATTGVPGTYVIRTDLSEGVVAGMVRHQGALFGVTSHDPLTYLSSAVVLILVALMASAMPAGGPGRCSVGLAARLAGR